MNNSKVLIVDSMHDSITSLFEGVGFEPHYRPEISPQEVYDIIENYEGLVIRSKMNVDKKLLDLAVNLKFVARAGAGIDKIDYPYLTEKGITLVNAPEGNQDAVGEHTIGMLLALFNNILLSNQEVKGGKWDREGNRGWELKEKTVGIYGYGHMGSTLAKKLAGFECKVIAYDKYKTTCENQCAELVSLNTFFEETEILSIHIPLTSETRFLFDATYFRKFKKLKVILNTSRGEVLKLSAVNDLLADGSLIGAGLDVLENEKINKLTPEQQLVFDQLTQHPNVILTPHVAGWTFESYRKINEVMVKKLQAAGLAHAG